jgi:DNA-directed RNA polymerase subunit RPC12/RpoP
MASLPNPYLRDAPYFLQRAIDAIADEADGPENLSHALDLALGFERILKGILWNEHPAFTLVDETFANMTKVLYADKMRKAGAEPGANQKKEANADSVTFRTAAARARLFSNAAQEQFSILMKLGHVRDIVVHNDLAVLDLKDTTFFIRRNLHPLLVAFSAEELFDAYAMMADAEAKLGKMAVDYIEDLETRVAKRLARHVELYRRRRTPVEYAFPAVSKPTSDQWDTPMDCPACGQKAFVREEVDFDYVDRQAIPTGAFITHLRCPHCRLFVEDYEELEEMGITRESLYQRDDE